MNHSRCKTFALALVAIMLFTSIPFTVSIYDDSSDAASTIDYTRWYYNQLDEPMQYAYDEFLNADVASTTITVEIPNEISGSLYNDYDYSKKDSAEFSYALEKLCNCLHIERPDVYFVQANSSFKITDSVLHDIKIVFTVEDANTSLKNKAVANAIASLNFTGTDAEKVKQTHDYLVKTLSYAVDELKAETSSGVIDRNIRSQYKALVGDHLVVCEGYAKAFKLICDYYGIPCLLISGDAYDGSSDKPEKHMWNLVYIENSWYTMDVTWDDPIGGSGIYYTYYLVGQNTVDDDGLTTAKSHSLNRVTKEFDFELPAPLASNRYGGENVTITFDTNGGTAIDPMTVRSGTILTTPSTAKYGYTFDGWFLDEDLTISWNNAKVTNDCTLHAKWTRDKNVVVTYVITYDNTGGTGGPGTISTTEDKLIISYVEPTRDGYVFEGWNTEEDGSGYILYGGESVNLLGDATLYAQWSVAPLEIDGEKTIVEEIDNFLKKVDDFMDDEPVDGVSNLYIVLGGVAVFLVIAVVAMRR